MDIRNIFKAASNKLMADFDASAEVNHSGGKGSLREDAFASFLQDRLPKRYGVGRGEVINYENYTSGQMDIVIYDPIFCPDIMSSVSHSIYPIESAFGAISVKSTLSSSELEDSYKNIHSFKRTIIKKSFSSGRSGFISGFHYPCPVTGILSYKSDRSLEAICAQIKKLDKNLNNIEDRPDFVCILDTGIIGPRYPIRGDFNSFTLPTENEGLYMIRKTGRHTLLKLYIFLLREMGNLTLPSLDLSLYEEMPKIVGKHRVRNHDRFALFPTTGQEPTQASRLTLSGVEDILSKSEKITMRDILIKWVGQIPNGSENHLDLNAVVGCYNPNHLPPITTGTYLKDLTRGATPTQGTFNPYIVNIDDVNYYVDFGSLPPNSMESNPDLTFYELMSL